MKSNEFGRGLVCGVVAIGILATGFFYTLTLGYKLGAERNIKELNFYKEAYEKHIKESEKTDAE